MKQLLLILAFAACVSPSPPAADVGPRGGDSGQEPGDAARADVLLIIDAQSSTDASDVARDAGAEAPDASVIVHDSGGVAAQDAGLPGDCDGLMALIGAEIQNVRSCSSDEQCGQVMQGTSCGCTRDWVARLDADLTGFNLLRTRGQQLECNLPFMSTCDCPRTDGFICAGTCQWNYTQ